MWHATSDPTGTARLPALGRAALLATLLTAIGAAGPGPALAQGDGSGTPETRIFLEDPTGYYLAELVYVGTYEMRLVYHVHFRGDDETLQLETGTTDDGRLLTKERSVAHLGDLRPDRAVLLACLEQVCRPLEARQELKGGLGGLDGDDQTSVRFTVEGGGRVLQRGMDVRLLAAAGWVERSGAGPSPRLAVTLPQLGERESTALASHPILKLYAAPVTREDDSDRDASALMFEGGRNLFRRSYRMGLQYEGTVTTDDDVGFNSLELAADAERNLLAGRADYLPLRLSLGLESDRSLDLVNGVLGLSLSYLLPWNANFSPPGEGYVPSTGPRIRLRAEVGTRLADDPDEPLVAAAPEQFERAGYELRWRLPVGPDTELAIHHAGLWVFSEEPGEDGTTDDFHELWDLTLETKIGNLSYYVGYQEGEAAPLFRPTETTQVGVLIRLGDRVKCSRLPGGSRHFTCGAPDDTD